MIYSYTCGLVLLCIQHVPVAMCISNTIHHFQIEYFPSSVLHEPNLYTTIAYLHGLHFSLSLLASIFALMNCMFPTFW